jgi:hypothetical protein
MKAKEAARELKQFNGEPGAPAGTMEAEGV